ncbi:TonB-dependent receptor domain-containing protein [Sphingobium sp.]|uniref:TonB-dependent receptor domain-containing protein n=1 Tax=Sphingobium sp. TaxID=1912891 RepID=UPI002C2DF49F|nr:TonB-dependent receptor [Sphingobium sp.]HUD92926.1 TonB-dependent receptor [Sphingobium sp.]
MVTGSRIKRDGYNAPTPETVITSANIETAAKANIADYVNTLPQLSAGSTPRVGPTTISSGSAGSNFLNLRGLGPNRTLILLDGRRFVGANDTGQVDVNTIPSSLVSRVDVVTGGASAAYGSGAVAGVVNFVLDTKFTGFKFLAQNSLTTYGDGHRVRLEGAFGSAFADGRGHFLASVDYSDSKGVDHASKRPWYRGQKIVGNPAFAAGNGQPTLINASNVNLATSTPGGLITSGILRGTRFDQGGAFRQHVFGTITGMYSIDGERNDLGDYVPLEAPVEQFNSFARASFDVSPALKLYAEGIYSKSVADIQSIPNFYFGNLTIQRDNAFLPDALRSRLVVANQSSFSYGSTFEDLGRLNPRNKRELYRAVIGADGDLGGSWSYNIYGQYGRTDVSIDAGNNSIPVNLRRAIDAVRNPGGQIVCRVNQVAVTDAACVPFNPFGIGVNSQAAVNYVSGTSSLRQKVEQTVVAGTIQGDLFSTWAGPVSIAVGGEYRKEQVRSSNDPLSQASAFLTGNYKATRGQFDLYEGFVETIVPLAKDSPIVGSLELNAALRQSHYSTSGDISAWKAGFTWAPVPDIRFRATRSRDVRAGNLNELFQAGIVQAGQTLIDRSTGAQTGGVTAVIVGNQALVPESADTITAGVVLKPRFLPGLSVSFDYYDIKIKDAILTLALQDIVDRCAAGNTVLCGDITRNAAGTITQVNRRPVNIGSERLKGFDIEASYRQDLSDLSANWNASLTLRSLVTHIKTRRTSDGRLVDETAGENSGAIPNWRLTNSLTYEQGGFQGQVTARTVTSGVYDYLFTPAVLADNRIPGATYVDLALSQKITAGGGRVEFFFNIDNLFNKDPVSVPTTVQPFLSPGVNGALYDVVGREFRVGVRGKF